MKYVCLHANFYQPNRENPWLEAVEQDDTSYPYHDWNERVTADCYAPNSAAWILNSRGRITDIVNNYRSLNFNISPFLLGWLKRNAPAVYSAIISADKEGQKLYGGHGPAIAQCYHHSIMPLCNENDKRTQVLWGIRDFYSRFGRNPEGMWLPEMAVDERTLEILAGNSILFTILSRKQALKTRKKGSQEWIDVIDGKIDAGRPYEYRLPSGKSIAVFFYDEIISAEIAFGGLLKNGEALARRIIESAPDKNNTDHISNFVVQGETFGHYHRRGEMALSYCLHSLESSDRTKITVYGKYLEEHPPEYEVSLLWNSSWSCAHGIERWRNNCGCNTGKNPGWSQEWRAPLRGALDWLSDAENRIYTDEAAKYFTDIWKARDEYIRVVSDRNEDTLNSFFKQNSPAEIVLAEDRVKALSLLEMQKNLMAMYAGGAWFYDEVSENETVQALRCAARAIQLGKYASGIDLEESFLRLLEHIPSNIKTVGTACAVYLSNVKPAVIDLFRVGAHYAISSLFSDYRKEADIFCYRVVREEYERTDEGRQKLATGIIRAASLLTGESKKISFAALYLGENNIICGVKEITDDDSFGEMRLKAKESFLKNEATEVIKQIDGHFGADRYSIWHLFHDEQRKVLDIIFSAAKKEIETYFGNIKENYSAIVSSRKEMHIPAPGYFLAIVEFVLNNDLANILKGEKIDPARISRIFEEASRWRVDIDMKRFGYIAGRRLNELMERLEKEQENPELLENISHLLDMDASLKLELNIWPAVNILFFIIRKNLKGSSVPQMEKLQALAGRMNIETE